MHKVNSETTFSRIVFCCCSLLDSPHKPAGPTGLCETETGRDIISPKPFRSCLRPPRLPSRTPRRPVCALFSPLNAQTKHKMRQREGGRGSGGGQVEESGSNTKWEVGEARGGILMCPNLKWNNSRIITVATCSVGKGGRRESFLLA